MSADRGSERRATPRYTVDLPASFWAGAVEVAAATGRVRDVSWGGLFLECEELQQPGTPLRLMVGISRPDVPVPLEGEVAWTASSSAKGPGMGVRLHTPL